MRVKCFGSYAVAVSKQAAWRIPACTVCVSHSKIACPDSTTCTPQLSWASVQPGGLRVRLGFFNIAELGELLLEPCRRAGLACRYCVTNGWHEVVVSRAYVLP